MKEQRGQHLNADSSCAAQRNEVGRFRSRNAGSSFVQLCSSLRNKRRNPGNYVGSKDTRIADREELVKLVTKDHTFQASFFDVTVFPNELEKSSPLDTVAASRVKFAK
jgi:hypothetical protein